MFSLTFLRLKEINQLTQIFALCGKPDNELTEKITSEEVLEAQHKSSDV